MTLTMIDPRWQAVIDRDKSRDGTFYYSVKTTGVYCRPSCGARLPRPENVDFHESCAAAEAAGFRPCKRCKPDGEGLEEHHVAIVKDLCRLIETSDETPTLEKLAAHAGLSPYHLHRMFKSVTGLTPKAYADGVRTKRMRETLKASNSVTEAIFDAGFNSSGRFYARTNAALGMTPKNYRQGGRDTEIFFTVGKCSLGAILVAMSARGICAISLGDDSQTLIDELRSRFPQSTMRGDDPNFETIVAQVITMIENPAGQGSAELPLDIQGTAFQQKVWQALRKIPARETVSYSELAKIIGEPGAVRAVASACGANKLAVVIPCHRVVRADGSPSGYRWGMERKASLIAREAGAEEV